MLNWMALLPSKVFCFLEFDPGAKILLALIILFRFICMILGCCYGPYLYLVLPLGKLQCSKKTFCQIISLYYFVIIPVILPLPPIFAILANLILE